MSRFPELQELMSGNGEFRNETEEEHPGLVEELAQGQHPKFAYLGCADSRVPETEVFGAEIGDLFVSRNVGNQFNIDDLSAETTISYAIAHLGVQHVIVMGHYGCGAVQAAIASESDEASTDIGEARIDTWIRPIRSLFKSSNHSHIVAFREAHADDETIAAPNRTEPAFRALVEENVKQQVRNLADDSSVLKVSLSSPSTELKRSSSSGEEPVELWLHGWVYDVDTGLVTDLGVSVGPSGSADSE
ncbi:carbonic anhydrase [Leucosporidium creatinivorum]|uniref:Carbonic anhydrase n=1 Tax=Leucosporidium creatinivorum TaxID=106004 RepID=A0A1Y2FYY4_9BASI|nr:carbonic anhydrase [Leucosporidium creatinivorum]